MRRAREYREHARHALRGHWGQAVGAGLIASLLGGSGMSITGSGAGTAGAELGLQEAMAMGAAMRMASVMSIAVLILTLIIGGAVNMGYCRYNLRLIDRREAPRAGMVVSLLNRILAGIGMLLLQILFVFLWALPGIAVTAIITGVLMGPITELAAGLSFDELTALITVIVLPLAMVSMIPAMIAAYRYHLMPYLMAEHPEMRAIDAMRTSKHLMKGKKWKLFCLGLSFIGWDILCLFTLGIGNLFLLPYRMAAEAAFVKDIFHGAAMAADAEPAAQISDGSEPW